MSRYLILFLIYIFSLLLGTSTFQATSKNTTTKPEEPLALKCLLNLPMGVSPAELREYLSSCISNGGVYDEYNNVITKDFDISSFRNQTIHRIYLSGYSEEDYSLHTLHFSFFKGKLYSVEGWMEWDLDQSEYLKDNFKKSKKEYYRQFKLFNHYKNYFGEPKLIKRSVEWEGFTKKDNYPNWKFDNKTFGFYDEPPRSVFFVQIDSIANLVRSIESLEIDVEVFLTEPKKYSKYQRFPDFAAEWHNIDIDSIIIDSLTNEEESPVRVDTLFFGLYCMNIGDIFIEGNGSDLTFTVTCENGAVVIEKQGINVKRKLRILKKGEFLYNCLNKMYLSSGNLANKYTLKVSKYGHPLFIGNIYIEECM